MTAKFFVLAKPLRAPKWWPRWNGRPAWVYVSATGDAWSLDRGDPIPRRRVRGIQAVFEETMDRRFAFRTENAA